MSCKLKHEKVQKNEVDLDRLEDQNVIFPRLGFCRKEDRNFRIGCAHTMANNNFKNLCKQVSELLNMPQLTQLRHEMDHLVTQIYILDYKKGQLEKELAIAEIKRDSCTLNSLSDELSQVEATHVGLIGGLESKRKLFLEVCESHKIVTRD
ncbi:hypothetical protein [Pedobacter sp. SYSU D00535]|uniref:hypothetical protein n=1 Tax=Pedobacter sp. SYSU D00535 TaxID=2810308 RepID=UPI001A975D24|nr:hypothetical protein [Pedobacter sp. SYSU D00535]